MKYILTALVFFCLTDMHAQSVDTEVMLIDSLPEATFSSVHQFLYASPAETNYFLLKNKSSSSVVFSYKPVHLPGLFCKMEYNIEQKSKLPLRFRLGSLNYTEWMEGKGEYYNRYKP